MSNSDEKAKNATRRHNDLVAVKRQIKIAKQHGMGFDNSLIREPHRLAKHHAMDCGDPGCLLCGNPRRNKSLKPKDRLTNQERRFYQDTDTVRDKHSNGTVPEQD